MIIDFSTVIIVLASFFVLLYTSLAASVCVDCQFLNTSFLLLTALCTDSVHYHVSFCIRFPSLVCPSTLFAAFTIVVCKCNYIAFTSLSVVVGISRPSSSLQNFSFMLHFNSHHLVNSDSFTFSVFMFPLKFISMTTTLCCGVTHSPNLTLQFVTLPIYSLLRSI